MRVGSSDALDPRRRHLRGFPGHVADTLAYKDQRLPCDGTFTFRFVVLNQRTMESISQIRTFGEWFNYRPASMNQLQLMQQL